jgi:hypothetical protein
MTALPPKANISLPGAAGKCRGSVRRGGQLFADDAGHAASNSAESGGMSSSHTTTMAWIILAACSLCLSTFPSRAETAEGAWQRMIGVQAKLKPLSDAWVNCTLRQADTFALQPEPIETIIPAIFAACSGFEQMMIKVLAENGMASQVDYFLRQTHATATQEITLEILKKRGK